MLSKYEAVSYELLRPEQVKLLRERRPVAYLPAGSLEWHSFQNPLGTDALKAHAICCEAALAHGGIVLPPIYTGLVGTWGPKGWEGYTAGLRDEEAKMIEDVVWAMVRSLIVGGWKVFAGVTGHDWPPQRDAIRRAIARATEGKDAAGFSMMECEGHKSDSEIPFGGDHAAAWETSCMLYACPGKADLDALRGRKLSSDENFEMSGPEGIGGKNPLKYASSQMGRKIVEKRGDIIGRKALDMLEGLGKK